MNTCKHAWTKQIDKGWDGTCTEYRKCTTCGLSNMYMGISNEEAEEFTEKCTQETFYEPDEWKHGGKTYLISLNNGLFIPHGEGAAVDSGTAVTYSFTYSASKPISYPIMKVSPHSALGKNLVKHE